MEVTTAFFIATLIIFTLVIIGLVKYISLLLKKFKVTACLSVILILVVYILYLRITSNTCDYWMKGLKDTKLDNNKEGIIQPPKIC